MGKKECILLITVCLLGARVCADMGESLFQKLDRGVTAFRAGNYDDAWKILRYVRRRARRNVLLKQKATFYMAETAFALRRFDKALRLYDEVMAMDGESIYSHRAAGRKCDIGKILLRTKKRVEDGVSILEGIISKDPWREDAADLLMNAGHALFNNGKVKKAEDVFRKVVQEYADSPRYVEAEYMLLKCMAKRVEGYPYDVSLCNSIVRRCERLLPLVSGKLKDDVSALRDRMRTEQARSWYMIGRFYRRKGEKKAAEVYERFLRERFPRTVWAQKVGTAR